MNETSKWIKLGTAGWQRFRRSEYITLITVLAALLVVFGVITHGVILSPIAIRNMLLQSSTKGMAAIGQAFVVLTGGIDLSVSGIGIMSMMIGAALMTQRMELNIVGYPMSFYVAVPLMLLVGTAMGALNGLVVSRFHIPPLIVTLGIWQIGTGLSHLISGGRNYSQLTKGLAVLGQGSVVGVPVPVIVLLVVVAVAYFVSRYTKFGRSVYAVGGNEASAWLSGVNTRRIQFSVYAISGLLAAVAGVSLEARLMSASIDGLRGLELDSIAAVAVGGVSFYGGRGNIIGVLIGTLIIGVVDQGLGILGAPPAVLNTVKGIIVITAVALDEFRRRSAAN